MADLEYPVSMSLGVYNVERLCALDSDGVPLVKYGPPIGYQYNPTTISQYALGLWEMMNNEESVQRRTQCQETFLAQVDWLRRHCAERNGFPAWTYNFDLPFFSLKRGWMSALSQGLAISVLLRSSTLGNQEDLYLAKQAYIAFQTTVDEGGVLTHTPEGFPWLEECPSAVPSLILNGFIYALFGAFELYRLTKDLKHYRTWQDGVRSLEGTTHFYDAGYWCYYDRYSRRPYPALISDEYMKFDYIPQYRSLYALTGNAFFDSYARRWKKYCESLTCNLMRKIVPIARAYVPQAEKILRLITLAVNPHPRVRSNMSCLKP